MKEQKAQLLVDCQNFLGEGVQWNEEDQRVYWTDIHGCKILSCLEDGSDLKQIDLPDKLGSFVFDKAGKIVAGFADGIYHFDQETGQRELVQQVETEFPTTRLNDGRCDRQGRYVVGSVEEGDMAPFCNTYIYDGEKVRTIIKKFGCANSITFSPDGKKMYFADTAEKHIYVYDYDEVTGTPGARKIFATLGEDEGYPDGSCVDAQGGVWNARFGGSGVQRYDSEGKPDVFVQVTIPKVTCACLGGKNLNKLYITTAKLGLSDEELEKYPLAGGLYVVETEYEGLFEPRFNG